MTNHVKVACLQLNSGPDIDKNLADSVAMIRAAAGQGAALICTPEYSCVMRDASKKRLLTAQAEAEHKVVAAYRALARELKVWIMLGSVSIALSPEKTHNRSLLIDADGNIVARYNKIHLFDVDLPPSADMPDGKTFRESDVVEAGDKAVVAQTPWGKMGLTICYDVRFPYLHRALAQAGATILSVPAAYSVPTGKTSWEVFVRARALENGCFVLAPAQVGVHEGTRETWGHAMIVGPWGEVLADAGGEKPGIIYADLDLDAVAKVRENIPSLAQQKSFEVEQA